MKSAKIFFSFALGLLLITGCSSDPEPTPAPTVDVEGTIAAGLAATQTAMPPPPTATPEPSPTDTPEPVVEEVEPDEEPSSGTEAVEPGFATNPSGSFIITIFEDGSRLYEVPASNFLIELPSTYETLDPADSEMLQAVLEESLAENAFSSEQMTQFAAAGIKLYSVNTEQISLESPNPASINIIQQELPIELTLEEFVTANQAQLPQFLDITSDITVENLTLGNQPAAALSYLANIGMPGGGTAKMANTQYMVLDPENAKIVYIITVAMEEGLVDDLGSQVRQAAETFRLLNDN